MRCFISFLSDIGSSVTSWLRKKFPAMVNIFDWLFPCLGAFAAVYEYRAHNAVVSAGWVCMVLGWIFGCKIISLALHWVIRRSFVDPDDQKNIPPRPSERFTTEGDDGEVTVPVERVEEMLLYLCELEDWLDRKGLL